MIYKSLLKQEGAPMEHLTNNKNAQEPEGTCPAMFGGQLEPVRLPWAWAVSRLERARNYWIATTRPGGRPHSRPVWGIWLENACYFSTGSLAALNLATQPAITLHLESGDEVVILEGVAEKLENASLLAQVVALYNQKYHWKLDPEQLPGPFYRVCPHLVLGWLSDPTGLDGGSAFHGTATRWRFPSS